MNNTASAALSFPYDTAPAPATLREVAPGVKWLRMPLPFALDHINLWALEDADGWTLIDFGMDLPLTRELWKQLLSVPLAGKPINRLIATHYHPDHLGCGGWLSQMTQAPLWMTAPEWDRAQMMRARTPEAFGPLVERSYVRAGLGDALQNAAGMDGYKYASHVGPLPEKSHAIEATQPIVAAGVQWNVIIGEGHSPYLATLYSPELGVLISGDQVLPGISPNISVAAFELDSNPLALFLSSLERYRELPTDTLVLPSHKLPFTGLHARVDDLIRHHEMRLNETVSVCRDSASTADVLRLLFRRPLDAHQLSFALGETRAHLNYLVDRGDIGRTLGADGIDRYQAS